MPHLACPRARLPRAQTIAKRRPAPQRRGPFAATLVRHQGKAVWVFAQIPKKLAPPMTRPWGRTPVRAVVDGVAWDTSIWRDSKSHGALLAVPSRIRGRKGHGDTVTVEFSFDPEDDDQGPVS